MPATVRGSLEFRPVGQGVFATGWLGRCDSGRTSLHPTAVPPFRWVYDCGSMSKGLQGQIDLYVAECTVHRAKPEIGMLFLSHFDKDHISGVVALLQRVDVDTLVLPFIPLPVRLMLAIVEGVNPGDPLFHFFENPVAFLRGGQGGSIRRIVLVLPGGEGGRPTEADRAPEPPKMDEPWRAECKLQIDDSSDESQDVAAMARGAGAGTLVQVLKRGGSLTVAQVWEFFPYNDAHISLPSESFIRTARVKANALLDATGDRERRAALDSLKSLFTKQFGAAAYSKNVISLFVFAGWTLHRSVKTWSWRKKHGTGNRGRIGALYTGDGYLNNDAKYGNLATALGTERMKRISVLQVMHHGSRKNWHQGVAAKLHPRLSVFCADPARKRGHPHREVVLDFLPYNPSLADLSTQVSLGFSAEI